MDLHHGTRTSVGLLALGLLAAGIPAWVTLDDHCPALTVVCKTVSVDVPMGKGYSSFIAEQLNAAGGTSTCLVAVSDWEPWLQAYAVAAIGATALVPVAVCISAFDAFRTEALTAAAVSASAGVVVSVVYALRLQGFANENTLSASQVDVGRCAAPTLFAGALLTQLALLVGVRYTR